MNRRLAITCAAALIFVFTAIGAQAAPVVESIVLSPETSTVDVGAELQLDAVLTPTDTGAAIQWTSSRPQYATVRKLDDDTCVITGKATGRTTITARAGGKSVSRIITVTAPKASSIKLNAKSVTLNPSGSYSTYVLRATTTPTYHSDSIVWTTDDAESAIISIEPSPDGLTCLVTAKSDGSEEKTCTVTATLAKAGKSAACQITVTKIPEKYVRVPTSAVVPLYATRTLTAVVYPTNAFDKTVTWEPVKNDNVVEIKDNGDGTADFTGRKSGTAIFRAKTANGRAALCAMTVKLVRYSSLSVTPSSKTVEKGKTYEIKLKRSPTYVSYPDVDVTSSDEKVATVALTDGKWIVTGAGRGYAKIYVKADKGRVNRTLTVRVLDYENPVTVTVSAIGDVMLGGDPRKDSFTRFDNLWNNYGSSYFFAKIKSELRGVVFANLEIPLIDTSYKMQGSRSYIFRGKTAYAKALVDGNRPIIDAVDLDNNHIMDYGSRGYSSTRSAVSGWNVGSFGLGKVFYKTANGVKIGFVGFRPENISTAQVKSTVRAVQSRCDVVIASFHWGLEHRYSPTGQQIAYGRAAVDGGADLVVGHHSHLVSGIELYKGKHIVYGLGTIVSAVERPDDVDTFIYQHTFSVTGTSVSNNGFEIVPVLMTVNGKNSYNDAQPVFATGDDRTRIRNKIEKYSPSKNPF